MWRLWSIVITVIWLLSPVNSWAAALTASVSGNINDPATFGGATFVNGDTITVNTGITLTVPAGVPTRVGAAGATGTAAITVAGTLSLHAPLTAAGDIVLHRTAVVNATADASSSGGITFDPPAGATYKMYVQNVGSGNPQLNFTGTSANRVLITTTQGGGGNASIDSAAVTSTTLNWSYVTASYLGAAAVRGVDEPNGGTINLSNVLFNSCGELRFAGGNASQILIIDNVDIRNGAATNLITITNSTDKTSGTRRITNSTAYSASGQVWALQCRNLSISGLYLYNAVLSNIINGHNGDWAGIMMIKDAASSVMLAPPGQSNLVVRESIFLTHFANPHVIDEGSATGSLSANIYRNNVFDGDAYWSSDAGDLVIVGGGAATVRDNIAINKAGTLGSLLRTLAIGTFTGNTSYGSYGVTVGETAGAATQLAQYQNNLVVSQPDGIHADTVFVPQTAMILDYNGYYDVTKTYDNYTAANGTAYLALSKAVRLSGVTATAGTSETKVFATGKTFITSGVTAGDWWYNTTRSLASRILSVDSETDLTLATAVSGQVAGDTGSIRKNYWATAGTKYGDNGIGSHDINVAPMFVDSTRTVRTYGEWDSLQSCAREMVTVNGIDYSGGATVATVKSVNSALAYIRSGFTPTNMTLATAGQGGTYIGAVPPVASTRPKKDGWGRHFGWRW